MGMNVEDASRDKRQILATIGISIAIFTTLLRLFIRIFRRTKLWYDDFFALLGLVFLVIMAIGGKRYFALDDRCTTPQGWRVALYYIPTVAFNSTIWISRLSILFSIIRLGFYRRRLSAAAACFILILVVLLAQIFWVCEPQNQRTNWKEDVVPKCILGTRVAVAQITTDAFADIILVTVPLLLLRFLESSEAKAQRVRLTTSFGVGGLTTLVSAVHVRYLIKGGHESIVVSNVKVSVSVIISNFTVIAAALHRVWNRYHPPKPVETLMMLDFGTVLPEQSLSDAEGTNTAAWVSTSGSGSGTRSGSYGGVHQNKNELGLFAFREDEASGNRTDDVKVDKE